MVKVAEVMGIMEEIAPKKLAENWDNPGLLVGSPNNEIDKILVALDADERVIDKAIEIDAKLIVTHHPLIFKPLKNIRCDLPNGAKLFKLIAHNISVFSAHTNLDSAKDGVNDILAKKLELINSEPLTTNENGEASLGRIGHLENEISTDEFIKKVKKILNLPFVKTVKSEKNKTIKKVALCGGSGAEFIDRAAFLGADVYVTGDVKYHDGQRAKSLDINVIDAGHFATEYPIVKELANRLKDAFSKKDVEIIADVEGKDVFDII